MRTYDTILATANRLFIKQGYTATSVRQIAQESRIGKATVYHYFPDKQSILFTLLKKDSFNIQDMTRIAEGADDPRQKIERIVQYAQETISKSIDLIFIARREVPEFHDLIQSQYESFFDTFNNLLSKVIRLGIDSKVFRPVGLREAEAVLMMMIQGMFAGAILSNEDNLPPDDLKNALLDVYFHGIENK